MGVKILYRLDSLQQLNTEEFKVKFITKVEPDRAGNFFDLDRVPSEEIEYVLNHERGHLVIGFICANKLEKIISGGTWSKNFRKEIHEEYLKQLKKISRLHDEYDEGTRHGVWKKEQAKWDRRLRELFINTY
ncbi:hypothetical protein [Pedobacter sp. BAL39]|uniref:DUF922 domain-containing protein n=1 Tax=Pedobacter sp. BAL39 TaxID=391596 RepID=UPI0012F89E48|nr:hypothetical protein [Pedobacter sp. BAL39]